MCWRVFGKSSTAAPPRGGQDQPAVERRKLRAPEKSLSPSQVPEARATATGSLRHSAYCEGPVGIPAGLSTLNINSKKLRSFIVSKEAAGTPQVEDERSAPQGAKGYTQAAVRKVSCLSASTYCVASEDSQLNKQPDLLGILRRGRQRDRYRGAEKQNRKAGFAFSGLKISLYSGNTSCHRRHSSSYESIYTSMLLRLVTSQPPDLRLRKRELATFFLAPLMFSVG